METYPPQGHPTTTRSEQNRSLAKLSQSHSKYTCDTGHCWQLFRQFSRHWEYLAHTWCTSDSLLVHLDTRGWNHFGHLGYSGIKSAYEVEGVGQLHFGGHLGPQGRGCRPCSFQVGKGDRRALSLLLSMLMPKGPSHRPSRLPTRMRVDFGQSVCSYLVAQWCPLPFFLVLGSLIK